MSKVRLAITFVAFVLVALVTKIYGLAALLFPFFLVSGFLVALAVMAFNAQIQVDANPGIDKLEKPDFWFSNIYNAWLYTTDIESWAELAATISVIASAFFGSLFGIIFLSMAQAASSGIYESWFTGMFLTCSIALDIVSLDYWKRQAKEKHPKVSTFE